MLEFILDRIEYYSTMEKGWTTDFIKDLYVIKRHIDEENKKRASGTSEKAKEGKQITKAKQKSSWK